MVTNAIRAVAVAGNLGSPSRSAILASTLLDAISELAPARTQLLQLAQLGPALGQSLNRSALTQELATALELVETANVLIVVTPVYRGSYGGLFKHFFDLVEQNALLEVPVILAATGGSERHALVLEHALRPLFAFFRAQTVPTALFASDRDFAGAEVSDELKERGRLAARQAVQLLRTEAESPVLRHLGAATLS